MYAKRVALAVVIFTIGQAATGQINPPAGWETLPPAELLLAVKDAYNQASEETQEAIRTRAKELLLDEQATADEPFYVSHQLFELAEPELTAAERTALANRLDAERDVASMSYDDLYHWSELNRKAEGETTIQDERELSVVIAGWIDNHAVEDLEESLYQFDWLAKNLTLTPWLGKQDLKRLTVTWQGRITAPQTGDYTFSPSEFDASTSYRENGVPVSYKQSMSATVGGQQVLNATADEWRQEDQAVSLTKGQPVPITVEYRYETSTGRADKYKPPLATLYWEGPGVTKTIVPPAAFTQPESDDAGLTAQYEIELAESTVTETVVEPNIDHVWYRGMNFVSLHPDAQQRAIGELWARTMSPEYWQSLDVEEPTTGDGPEQIHYLANRPHMAAYLSAAQRDEFLETLLLYPNHLARMPWWTAREVFHHYRFGAPARAIEFLGSYLQDYDLNAEPTLALDFFEANRARYWYLAIPVFWQYPPYAEILEQDYLELADGSCCLSVAYLLAYGHLQKGEIREWIDFLEARLADEQLLGDLRVNWLIARAMAEEIRRCPAERDVLGQERWLSGRGWLDEATLTAETQKPMLRAVKERIAQLVAVHRWEAVENELQDYPIRLATWAKPLESVKQEVAAATAKQGTSAQKTYVAELARRFESARARGDDSGAALYRRLISAAGESSVD